MSLINVDATAIANSIDSLIFEELYKKAVLASKDDDEEDLGKILDELFGEVGEKTRESIPEEDIIDIKESDIDEIYFLREILETIAIKEAIKNINEEQLKKLKDLNINIKESKKDHNMHLLFIQNKDFHLYLYNIANKPYLLKLIKQLWTWTSPYRSIYYNRSKQKHYSRDLHAIIIKACEEKIPEIAVEAMENHFDLVKVKLKTILKNFKKEENNE